MEEFIPVESHRFISSITMENVRGFDEKVVTGYQVGGATDVTTSEWPSRKVHISGRNGACKSAVKEAIVYALTGRDSSGSSAPSHLIKHGEKGLKVNLHARGWGLSVTLTRKKNSTINLVTTSLDNAFSATLSHTERMKFLGCSEDVALSAILPGYLMSRPVERRYRIFTEVLPRLDRNQLVVELSGRDPMWIHSLIGDLNETAVNLNTVVKKVIDTRLSEQKLLSRTLGQVDMIESSSAAEQVSEPFLTEGQKVFIRGTEEYFLRKRDYLNAMTNYFQQKSNYDAVKEENEKKSRRHKELTEEIQRWSLESWPMVDVDVIQESINDLRTSLITERTERLAPLFSKIPDVGVCSSCGQVVGIAHRAAIEEENSKKLAALEEERAKVVSHNAPLLEKIKTLEEEISKARKHNEEARFSSMKALSSIESAKRQLSMCNIVHIEEPIMPEAPETTYTDKEISEAKFLKEKYQRELGAYEAITKNRSLAASNLSVLRRSVESLQQSVISMEYLEKALREIPEEEMKRQGEWLDFGIEGLNVQTGEGSFLEFSMGETPYECLSTGERMRVDTAICAKFHNMLAIKGGCKLPRVIFLDNADLADWSYEKSFKDIQLYCAYVKESDLEVDYPS